MSKKGVLRTYKSYLFRDKDPVIDSLRTAVSDSRKSYQELHVDSSVSVSTMRGWFTGDVRQPKHCTIVAVARACGKRGMRWKADGTPVFTD